LEISSRRYASIATRRFEGFDVSTFQTVAVAPFYLPQDGATINISAELLLRRFAKRCHLQSTLAYSPSDLTRGSRQCGAKTLTLMETAPSDLPPSVAVATLSRDRFRRLAQASFDDNQVRTSVDAGPMGSVADLRNRVILDEVQCSLSLCSALKREIEPRRVCSGFEPIGLANVTETAKLGASSMLQRSNLLPAVLPCQILAERCTHQRRRPKNAVQSNPNLESQREGTQWPASLTRKSPVASKQSRDAIRHLQDYRIAGRSDMHVVCSQAYRHSREKKGESDSQHRFHRVIPQVQTCAQAIATGLEFALPVLCDLQAFDSHVEVR